MVNVRISPADHGFDAIDHLFNPIAGEHPEKRIFIVSRMLPGPKYMVMGYPASSTPGSACVSRRISRKVLKSAPSPTSNSLLSTMRNKATAIKIAPIASEDIPSARCQPSVWSKMVPRRQ